MVHRFDGVLMEKRWTNNGDYLFYLCSVDVILLAIFFDNKIPV